MHQNESWWGRVARKLLFIWIIFGIGVLTLIGFCAAEKDRGALKVSQKVEENMVQVIKYFREMDFFTNFKGKTDAEVLSVINKEYQAEWGSSLDADREMLDLTILGFDKERVWWEDAEADVCAENKVYVEVLQAWKRISRGSFNPVDIEEDWKGEAGPVIVSFKINLKKVVLHPKYLDDFIDLEVLKEVNKLIADTGYSFEVYGSYDQTVFIVVLTKEEKQKLIQERHWRFW